MIKVTNPRPYFDDGNTNPKSTLGQTNPKSQQVHFHENDHPPDNSYTQTSTQIMVHECLPDGGMDPSDINNIISAFKAKTGNPPQESSRKINTHQRYVLARAYQSTNHLVDRGANGGLACADIRVLQKTERKINIVGIDDDELTGLDVVTTAALFDTQKGPAIGIFHEYADLGKGRSIHGAGQMEWFNCKVDERSKVVRGAQRIETTGGYVFSFSIESGLGMCTPSGSLLMITFSNTLIRSSHHLAFGILLFWIMVLPLHFLMKADDSLLQDSIFDEFGDLQQQVVQHRVCSGIQSQQRLESILFAYLHESNPAEQDWKSLRSYFGWQSEQVIQDTYKVTSRFGGTVSQHDYLKNHFKSRNPVINIPRRKEPEATDTDLVKHLPFMMEVLWHNSLLAMILWYVMPMGSRARNNLSIHSMIISRQEELLSLMVEKLKSQRKLLTFSGAYS